MTAPRPLTRRLAPLLVGLGLGLAALTVALVALAGTFATEHAASLSAARTERTALERYAAAALSRRIEAALADARERAPEALADPLVDPRGLVVFRGGAQLLPYPTGPADAAPGGIRAYWDLVGGVLPAGDGPWRDRALLLGALRSALAREDVVAIAAGARDLLRHIAHYRLRVDRDLASLLAFVDRFAAEGRPSAPLLSALLRDGLALDDGAHLTSLQRALLGARARLAPDDFTALAERVSRLSARAGVAHEDFDAAATRPATAPLAMSALTGPVVTPEGLALMPVGDEVVGVTVDLAALAGGLTAEMRRGSLLGADELLAVRPQTAPAPLDAVEVEVRSGRWAAAADAADRQFAYKTALVVGAGVLALLLAALAVLLQVKKARYLALRSHFVSAVSHELRTPLASIGLLAETLARRLAGRPEARDYPARILRDAQGMGVLVDNILSFNRLEHGHWRPQRVTVGAGALLGAVAQDARAHARRPVEVRVDAPPGLALDGDPELLRLALSNLVRNAITYGVREPVQITLAASVGARGITLSVADNGPGVPAADRARIFDEFRRGGASAGTRGSGLGLAICRRVATLHAGRAALRTSTPGGSVFTIAIPSRPRRTRSTGRRLARSAAGHVPGRAAAGSE